MTGSVRHLIVVFGDQLNHDSAALADCDDERDAILMMEVDEEATYIPQHKQRLVLFFSAMRHFRDELEERGRTVHYARLDGNNNRGSFAQELRRWINKTRPERVIAVRPGDYRVEEVLRAAAADRDTPLDVLEDEHFMTTGDQFREFAKGRRSLVLESFYREMRKRHDILMEDGKPVGGRWNYDEDNRDKFGADGPGDIKSPRSFRPDDVTRDVMALVADRYSDSPGDLDGFDYPVTHRQARAALRDFIEYRLPHFGRYQDAMATGRPYLYHSRLTCAMNLHLLDPRDVVAAAVDAYEKGEAPLNSVEGFVRQVIGWREYIRGVYWLHMPDYQTLNALAADLPAPALLWTGDTDMNCIRECVAGLRQNAYAHHIQRLMVLGLFNLLLGVDPYEVHRWHMSMYADAVDWVSLPNVLGMSQFGDGGIVGTKPYCASGNYINKMSDYCGDCRYDYRLATGDDACPMTTLYWDFLSRHRRRFEHNRRMGFQLKNLDRKSDAERRKIRRQASDLKARYANEGWL